MGKQTSVDNVPLMEIVDRIQDLPDGLRGVLLRELAILADPVEQLSTSSQLSDDVVFVLLSISPRTYCHQLLWTHPRLKPVVEMDDVRVVQRLQHLQLIIDHLLVALDILLEDDLHSDLSSAAFSLANNAICASAQCLPKPVLRSVNDERRMPRMRGGTRNSRSSYFFS